MPELKPSRSAKKSVKASRVQKKATKQQAKANRETTKKQIKAMAKAGTMKAAEKPTSEQSEYDRQERYAVRKKRNEVAMEDSDRASRSSNYKRRTNKEQYAEAIRRHDRDTGKPDSKFGPFSRPVGKK